MNELLQIMARLRDPEQGCPWDRKQTFATIVPYTIEEAYEVADAIEHGDMQELREELGDLLFQVVFYSQLAQEAGHFDFADVVEAISAKMIRRHPHVFAGTQAGTEDDLRRKWEQHKESERAGRETQGPASVLDAVAKALPALLRAEKLQKRAAKVGFDWPDIGGVLAKVTEELHELTEAIDRDSGSDAVIEEVGDLLFSCVNLARHVGVDAEVALRRSNDKFEQRFRRVEVMLARAGKDVQSASLEEMDVLWDRVKTDGSGLGFDQS